MSSSRTAGVILAVLGTTLGITSWMLIDRSPTHTQQDRQEQIVDVPNRMVELLVDPANPDAGEGAKAKAEEFLSSDVEQSAEAKKEVLAMLGTRGEASTDGGLEEALASESVDLGSGLLTPGISGLIGSKGTLADSGSLGGGGHGAGFSGRGSGSFGAKRPTASLGGQSDVESGEDYTSYGINAQTLVEQDPLSTFSIDVDTASYTIARSKLLTGQLPPEAAVRVEEFVNYFSYRYADRADDAPFAVYMEAAPSPWQPSHHVLRVGLQGDRIDEDARKPVRLTFLVDVSGSMSANNKLPLARKAMRQLVDNLGPEDSVAITTYAGRTEILLQPTAADERAVIHDAIEQLQSGGGTNMDSGIQLAYQLADQAFVDGAENRVIVLSDGDANVGRTSHETLLTEITGYAKKGVTLSTIGFGRGNYQDTLMEQLANKGDGNYFYIDDYTEAKKVFGQDLSGTIQTIARDVKIQVEFDPDAVLSYRLIGYENRDIADADFRNDAVDAGEIGSGHAVTALYDVILRDDYREHDGPLATVRLRAKPPGADAAAEEWFTTYPAADVHDELASTTDSFRLALGAGTFAEKLRGSHFVEEITYRQLAALVEGASQDDVAIEAELVSLINQAGSLSGESGFASR